MEKIFSRIIKGIYTPSNIIINIISYTYKLINNSIIYRKKRLFLIIFNIPNILRNSLVILDSKLIE